jgi:hypothetical protein
MTKKLTPLQKAVNTASRKAARNAKSGKAPTSKEARLADLAARQGAAIARTTQSAETRIAKNTRG